MRLFLSTMENVFKIKPIQWREPAALNNSDRFRIISDVPHFDDYSIEYDIDSEFPRIIIDTGSNCLADVPKGFMTLEKAKEFCQNHFDKKISELFLTPA